MDKDELVHSLQVAHEQFRAALDALSDEELALRAQGDWSRRDLVAHVEWWERHSLGVVTALRDGREPYPAGGPFDLDAQNARVFEENRGRTAADVRSGEAAAWAELRETIEAASEADLFDAARFGWTGGTALADTIRSDTDQHWAEHLPDLRPASGDTPLDRRPSHPDREI